MKTNILLFIAGALLRIIRDKSGYFVGAFFHSTCYGLDASVDKAFKTYRGAYNAGMRILNKYIGQRDKVNKLQG